MSVVLYDTWARKPTQLIQLLTRQPLHRKEHLEVPSATHVRCLTRQATMAEESLQGVVVCSLDVRTPGKAQQAKPEGAELPRAEPSGMLGRTPSNGTTAEVDSPKLKPLMLVAAADMYSLEPKPASVAGGILTVLALMAAVAYAVSQVCIARSTAGEAQRSADF